MWTDMSIATIIFFFFFSLAGLWIGRIVYLDRKRERMLGNFANYTAILEYYMEKAYDIIHKDKILIHIPSLLSFHLLDGFNIRSNTKDNP